MTRKRCVRNPVCLSLRYIYVCIGTLYDWIQVLGDCRILDAEEYPRVSR